jgi:hypothetical protein
MRWSRAEIIIKSAIHKSKGSLNHASLFPVAATMSELGVVDNVRLVTLSGILIIDAGGRLIMPIADWSDYKHFAIPCDRYDQLDRVSFVTLTKKIGRDIIVTWVESNVVKDRANYYGMGSYHPECKKAFRFERWTLEPEHVKEISSLRDELCRSQS